VSEDATEQTRQRVEAVYRSDSRRVLATLIRLLGDFDLAEEALHDAFTAAAERWARDGEPANPRAWLVSTGRFKAIDALRRRARFDASVAELAERLAAQANDTSARDDEDVEDDRLRLIFTCCHPALRPDAQVPLTLREVCGLRTEEIARAFLTAAPTLAQRIVRAKAKIRDARIPYQVPSRAELADRLDAVLQVIYLVFNEGYSASSGESLTRPDVSGEAIRLGRLMVELLQEPEAKWKRSEPPFLSLMCVSDFSLSSIIDSEARGVTIAQLDSIDPTLVVYRAEAVFVGVGLWELYSTIVSPGARVNWDKGHEDAVLLDDVNELTELWHWRTKPNWPAK